MVRRSAALLLVLLVSACGGNQTTPLGSPDPITTTVSQGRFVLAFTIDRVTVHATDAVSGTASLTLLTPGAATVTGSSALVIYEFTEVGGSGRQVVPSKPADCAPQQVSSSAPLATPIQKSGTVPAGADSDWYRQFLQDPLVHLPKGDWDITAIAAFDDGKDCSGAPYDLQATVRVHVIG
jgi:hypothetical protein